MPHVIRDLQYLHPLLREEVRKIQRQVIDCHRAPFRVFETARTAERQLALVQKGKVRTLISRHVFDLDSDPKLYSTAVNFVYYTNRWSWDLRNRTVKKWYELFGEMVLDACPALNWAGSQRRNEDYSYFELSKDFCDEHNIIIPRGAIEKETEDSK